MTRTEPTQHEIDLSVWSDLHKDVYGFRPRGEPPADLAAEFARLQAQLEINEAEERKARLRNQKALKARLRIMMRENRVDALTALRWDYEALDAYDDWGSYCFTADIGYALERYLDRREIKSPAYLARLRDVAEDMRGDFYD